MSLVEQAAGLATAGMGARADRCTPLDRTECPPVSKELLPGLRLGFGGVRPRRTPREDARSQAAAILLNRLTSNVLTVMPVDSKGSEEGENEGNGSRARIEGSGS